MNLDKVITIVKEYIEEKLGGNITVTKNREIGMVIFHWEKNNKTLYAEHLSRAYSYEELEQVVDPIIIGKHFVEVYTKSKEPVEVLPVVEEPKKKQTRKKKVEETVELEQTSGYIAGVDDIPQDETSE